MNHHDHARIEHNFEIYFESLEELVQKEIRLGVRAAVKAVLAADMVRPTTEGKTHMLVAIMADAYGPDETQAPDPESENPAGQNTGSSGS